MAKEFQLSVDAEALIKAYEAVPNKLKDEVRLQLKIAVEQIRDYASKHHRYISRRGSSGLEGKGIATDVTKELEGILWLDLDRVPYARAIHEGRGEITIVPDKKKALRWVNRSGNDFVFAKRVTISELKPDPFLYEAAEHELPAIEQNFQEALQKLIEV